MNKKMILSLIAVTIMLTATAVFADSACPDNYVEDYLETITVPSTTPTGASSSILTLGTYIFVASGTWNNQGGANILDAEYSTIDNWATPEDGYEHSPYFLGVDFGDLQVDGSFVDWGAAYNPTHEYSLGYTGTGSAANFRIFDGDSDVAEPNSGWYGDNSGSLTVDIYECVFVRSAEITSPTEGEEVYGQVSFDAVLTDKDGNDNVQWAVREGTCAAGTNTVFGNVDGYTDSYDWDGANFHALANTSTWNLGEYCFVFNPTESAGDTPIRETREFVLVDKTAPIITFVEPVDGSVQSGVINLKAECNEVCNYVNFWWRAEDETYSSASKRYHYVHEDGMIFEWDLDTLNAQKADGSTYVMEDGIYYLYAAGKDLAGNWARTPEIQVTVDNDLDDDEILDGEDMCLETVPDVLLKEDLGTNRWIWNGDDWVSGVIPGKGNAKGPDFLPDMEYTNGCSCEQILDILAEKTGESFGGHYKFGCSKSILEDWNSGLYYLDSVVVPSDESVASTTASIMPAETYVLHASGTYVYGTWTDPYVADAKCSHRAPGVLNPNPYPIWLSGDDLPAPYTNYLEIKVNGGVVDWGVTSGECNSDNIYTMLYIGADHLDFNIYDGGAIGDNSGSLLVDISVKLW